MGYSSYIASGQEIVFSRPLTGGETRALESILAGQDWAPYFLNLEVQEESVETDEGTLTRRTASALSTSDNEGKASGLARDLQGVIDALPSDVTASGSIERIGEEWPDAERLHVVGRKVVSVKPIITWPETQS